MINRKQKTVFFLKTENMVFLNNIFKLFSTVFTYFFKAILENNNKNMEND